MKGLDSFARMSDITGSGSFGEMVSKEEAWSDGCYRVTTLTTQTDGRIRLNEREVRRLLGNPGLDWKASKGVTTQTAMTRQPDTLMLHYPPSSLLPSPLMISGCSEVEPGRWHFKKNDFTAPGSNQIYIFFYQKEMRMRYLFR